MTETGIRALYDELAALPIDEQRRATTMLPDDTRAALWVFHLRTFLDGHAELTDEQRAIVSENIDLLSRPGFFRKNDEGPEHEAMRAAFATHKKRAEAAFPPEVLYALFFRLGGSVVEMR